MVRIGWVSHGRTDDHEPPEVPEHTQAGGADHQRVQAHGFITTAWKEPERTEIGPKKELTTEPRLLMR